MEMLSISGPDMIEYAMTCVSNEVLAGEGERCVPAYGLCVSARVGACTEIYSMPVSQFAHMVVSSFSMQSSLMHMVMTNLKKDPVKYGAFIDV